MSKNAAIDSLNSVCLYGIKGCYSREGGNTGFPTKVGIQFLMSGCPTKDPDYKLRGQASGMTAIKNSNL